MFGYTDTLIRLKFPKYKNSRKEVKKSSSENKSGKILKATSDKTSHITGL